MATLFKSGQLLPDITGRLCKNISARILNEKQLQEPKWGKKVIFKELLGTKVSDK